MKRFLSWMIIAALFCGVLALPGVEVSAAETDPATQPALSAPLHVYEAPTLIPLPEGTEPLVVADSGPFVVTDSVTAFYAALRENLMARYTGFTIEYNGAYADLPADVADMLEVVRKMDDPSTSDDGDFLVGSLLRTGYSCSYTSTWCQYNFSVVYTETAEQVKAVNREIAKILDRLHIRKLSQTARVKAIHDYLANRISYDQTLVDHSAYGGLVDQKHQTVCQGYALLFYKMLTDAGVTCRYVTGYAGGYHAWNMVKLSGKWYYVDVTWDDPISATPVVDYSYFLVGSGTMNRDHGMDGIYAGQYKAEKSDLSWKKVIASSGVTADAQVRVTQTTSDADRAAAARIRADYAKELSDMIDEAFDYAGASDYQKELYDLYKKVITAIIANISENRFEQLQAENDELFDILISRTYDEIDEKIMSPALAYVASDQFLTDAQKLLYADFAEKDLAGLNDAELERLSSTYAYRCFINKMAGDSAKYTDAIVDEIVDEINNTAF